MVLRLCSLPWLATLLLVSGPLLAAEPAPDCPEGDATVCGRKHFERGAQAFEKGDFAGSATEFEAALAQRPHPVIRFNFALALARLGRPSAAIAQLRQVIEDPATDKELRGRAERERKSAEQALSRVTFRLSDPTRERVELDGARVDLAGQGELSIDPGMHHVRVISNSSVVLDQDLDLAPGERVELRVGERSRRIDVVVVPDAAPAAPSATPPVVVPAPQPADSGKLPPTWFFVGVGATVALGGLTVWSGLDTQRAHDDYERDLPRLTQGEADERVKDGHSLELRTNLLLAGTLVAGAGTAVLGVWFTSFSGKAQAAVGVAPGRLFVSGRF
ncbi:MAG: tetratricopeptide repeat protein [Myxococcales bacterium]|nr:MAG: tetratricopeptide repeat protein [Myxococcales bacterium]